VGRPLRYYPKNTLLHHSSGIDAIIPVNSPLEGIPTLQSDRWSNMGARMDTEVSWFGSRMAWPQRGEA
jgi:hypothetical protein